MEYLLPSLIVNAPTSPAAEPSPDGRSTRWDEHRQARRRELVQAALRAIRERGAQVGMDDIAAVAGTSKTVFYRHFSDRAGLYHAITEQVDRILMRDVRHALGSEPRRRTADTASQNEAPDAGSVRSPITASDNPRTLVKAAVSAYLRMIERDPEVYRFVVAAPILARGERELQDAVGGVTSRIATQVTALIEAALESVDRSTAPAFYWGHAMVGMFKTAGDQWLARGAGESGVSVETLTEQLTEFIWGGLSAAWSREPTQPPHHDNG